MKQNHKTNSIQPVLMGASMATLAAGLALMLIAFVAVKHGTSSWQLLDLLGIILTVLGFAAGIALLIRQRMRTDQTSSSLRWR